MKSLTFKEIVGNIRLENGVIELPNGKYITIVEIAPTNFDYKTKLDKDKIIDAFAQFTKVGPVTMQIKSMSRRADTSKYINVLRRDFNAETDPHLKPYQEDYIRLIKQLGVHSGLSRRYFIVLEACGDDAEKIKNMDEAIYYLNKSRKTIRKYIQYCGNAVILHEDENEFVLNTLFEFANKKKTIHDLRERKAAFYEKARKIADNDEELLDAFDIPIHNLISPEKVEFFNEYCVVDGTYYAFLYIPSREYLTRVSAAWLTGIFCGEEGIDVDLFIEKKDARAMKNRLRNKIRINTALLYQMKNTEGENFEEMGKSIRSSSFIKNSLSNGEDFFYITTMFTISADSQEELYQKVSEVTDMFVSIDIDLAECEYKIKEAFSSYMPLNTLDPYLYNRGKRNVTTSGLSAFYPFNSFEVSDTDGVLLGLSENMTMLVIDNFDSMKYSNANIVMLGTSGSGKTFTLQNMCLRFRLKGVQTFVILPEKGDEFERGCRDVNGSFVTIASGSSSHINIMEIRPQPEDNLTRLGLSAKRKRQSILSEKIDSLLTFFSLAIGEMSNEELTLLDDAIIKTYALKGITKDNDSLIASKKQIIDKETNRLKTIVTYKEMPILADLHKVLQENEGTSRLARVLARFVTGSASSFNGQTNIDLDNKYIVFDLTYLSKELKALGMFVALDFIWDKARQDKTQKKIIAVDEAWNLLCTSKLSAEFLVNVFKMIRGYGGCGIAATQDVDDFFALENGKYGKAILTNSAIKMLMRLTEDEGKTVQEHFDLTYEELKMITSFDRGQSLIRANQNSFFVNFKASRRETLMTTSDRKLLQKIANGERITSEDLAA